MLADAWEFIGVEGLGFRVFKGVEGLELGVEDLGRF